ncbi:Alkaline ceramidase 3, partial [Linnemannia zychae]
AKHGPQGRWFPLLLAAWLITTTIIFSTASGNLQFYTFQSTYTLLQFGMIYYLRVLHVQQRSLKGPNPHVSQLIRRSLGFALFAVSIWLIDLRACEFINGLSSKSILKWNPQLHAWWHVFSACALYHATMLVIYYHYDVKTNIGNRIREKSKGITGKADTEPQQPYVDRLYLIFPVIRLGHSKR